MLNSILTGLSGLLAFSRGLDVLSNNVANMNTPGFKGSELAFRDMLYQQSARQGGGEASIGQGVNTGSTHVVYRQGELRETGNALDIAIDGNGFFIVRDKGEMFYTRSGQFEIDEAGFLTERGSGARVAALSGSGQLVDINIARNRIAPPKPTSKIAFVGTLSIDNPSHKISGITVFDAAGSSHVFSVNFTNNKDVLARSWLVEVRDEKEAVVGNGEIRFEGTGIPTANFNKIQFDYAPSGLNNTSITLDFGDPDSNVGTRAFSAGTTSDVKVDTVDGFAPGSITESSVSEKGELTLKYSNGQTNTFDRLALARFDNPQTLTQIGNGMFRNTSDETMILGAPDSDGMGKAMARRVELSNVELTEQFTDMVVLQRGYQASSQVISVTNEMIQQLMDIRARR